MQTNQCIRDNFVLFRVLSLVLQRARIVFLKTVFCYSLSKCLLLFNTLIQNLNKPLKNKRSIPKDIFGKSLLSKGLISIYRFGSSSGSPDRIYTYSGNVVCNLQESVT